MTQQIDIINDEKYRPVLDHGFVGLVDFMGDDEAIERAARLSYGKGTRNTSQTRTLLRYLMRHYHQSPTEMVEIKLHVKCPLFIARQWFRHRTHSANEYSGRYSVMSDECYMPVDGTIQPQSMDNKQGRNGELSEKSISGVKWILSAAYEHSLSMYKILLGNRNKDEYPGGEISYDPFDEFEGDDALLPLDFEGIARESARMVLPQANYTEFYWKQNLHNLFHLIKLRADSHAQLEIRLFAEAIFELIQPIVPISCEAFVDYRKEAVSVSRMEKNLLRDVMKCGGDPLVFLDDLEKNGSLIDQYGLTKREIKDFRATFTS